MNILKLEWDKLHKLSKFEILISCCLNTNIAKKQWSDIEDWLQNIIKDSVQNRSNNTCTVG